MANRDFLSSCSNEIGLNADLWVIVEDAFGYDNTVAFTADDYLEHLAFTLEYTQAREDSEARSGRSLATRLSGKIETNWSSEFYIIPKDPTGADPALPDMHPFLLGLFGSVDESISTEKKYEFVTCNEVSLAAYMLGDNYSQTGQGLVVNQGTFTLPGDGMAKAAFEGFAQDVQDAQRGVLASAPAASNDLVLGTGEGNRFDVGAYIDVRDQADGSLVSGAHKITAINGDTITVDGAAITAALGDLVTPMVLGNGSFDTSDKAMIGLEGTVEIDGIAGLDCDVLSAEIGINNNFTPKNNIYGTESICGFLNDQRREVTVAMEIQLNRENYDLYRKAKRFETANVTIKLFPNNGDSSVGRTFTFSIPRLEFDIPAIERSADGPVTLSFEGRALSTDAATPNTEMTLTIGPV